MKIIKSETALVAWKNAVQYLLANGGEDFNLLVEIENGATFDPTWITDYDPSTLKPEFQSTKQVIDTIFPEKIYRFSNDRQHFHKRYRRFQNLNRAMRPLFSNKGQKWGTYFGRLVNFGGSQKDQLEDLIDKMRRWNNHKGAYLFHTSSPETDKVRQRGGPCLQYGQFIHRGNDVYDLTVVYRNQDYFSKALGNFIGLGNVLGYVCHETGKEPGRLICHSVHAYFESSLATAKALAKI